MVISMFTAGRRMAHRGLPGAALPMCSSVLRHGNTSVCTPDLPFVRTYTDNKQNVRAVRSFFSLLRAQSGHCIARSGDYPYLAMLCTKGALCGRSACAAYIMARKGARVLLQRHAPPTHAHPLSPHPSTATLKTNAKQLHAVTVFQQTH